MKTLTEKLFLIILPLLFTFPIFKENLSSGILIAIVVNTILFHFSIRKYPAFTKQSFLLTIPFWIVLVHSFLSNTLLENEISIKHALFFLIVPLTFSQIPNRYFEKEKFHLYLDILRKTCGIIGLVYLIGFFLEHNWSEMFIVFNNVSKFRDYVYYDLKIIQIHPTYYTSILVLCSVYSFDRFLKLNKYQELLYVSFFLLISFLLLSRLNIVFQGIILLGILLFNSNYSLKKKSLLAAGMISLLGIMIVVTPGVRNRFVEVYNSLNKPPIGADYDSTNIRKAIFDCSVSLIKTNYISGVGFNAIQRELNNCYQENYFSNFYYENQYMTHNYFFYMLISSGIMGFLCFLYYVFRVIRIAIGIHSFLFSVFLINILFMSLIEDFMYRHYGGLYFNLLLMVFLKHAESNRSLSHKNSFTGF